MKKTILFIQQLGYFKTIGCFTLIILALLLIFNYKTLTTHYTNQEDLLNHPIYNTLLTDLEIIKTQDYGNDFRKQVITKYFDISLSTESKLSKEYINKGEYLTMTDKQLYKSVIELITSSFLYENKTFKEEQIPEDVINIMNNILNPDISGFYEQLDRIFKDPEKRDMKYNSEKIYKLYTLVNIKWERVVTYMSSASKKIGYDEWKGLTYKNIKNE